MSERQNQRLTEAETSVQGNLQCLDNTISSFFMNLPNEIIYMIIALVPRPWKHSLGSTCKFLSMLTKGELRTRLEGPDRTKFLTTLQKDVPNTYYCWCCARLRPLDPKHEWETQHHTGGTSDFKNSRWLPDIHHILHVQLPKNLFLFLSKANISFMEPYLVMNQHFLGPSHGLPLQSLERYEAFETVLELKECLKYRGQFRSYRRYMIQTDLEPCLGRKTQLPGKSLDTVPRGKDAWRFTFQMTPKIIDDKLYISRAYTVVGPWVSEEDLKRLIETMAVPLCSHLSCVASPLCCHQGSDVPKPRFPFIHARQLVYCVWADTREMIVQHADHGSCVLCSTDYETSLEQNKMVNEIKFQITTWHCLGSCRSPDDELWTHIVSSGDHPCLWASQITYVSDDGAQSPVHRYTPRRDTNFPSRFQDYTCLIPESYIGAVRRNFEAACSE
ncbi:hypothetical protein A9Z42_0025510 [Trichoderma parareesei]|uniref:F-box domain-containing protein n=1 Tax=Trichoderma parareesei TaxID=858221 RepID=A0A2H2Z7C3_TRIPA|nr:hypothetical protein A9Z42_0025510 [Trichoderma parareesei]